MNHTKNILLICINYNSDKELARYIESVKLAYNQLQVAIHLEVIIADNSTQFTPFVADGMPFKVSHLHTGKNLGYMGGATYAMEKMGITPKEWDLLIISNVDLELDREFLYNLASLDLEGSTTGWIVPAIYSRSEERNRAPKRVRYSRKRLIALSIMFRYPILHYLYNRLFYRRQRTASEAKERVYAGHGSIMVFTQPFIAHYSSIVYPSFLFGEEIFFAEELRRHQLDAVYHPEIVCYDDDHVSTSRMKRRLFYQYNYNSLKFLINTYF